MTLADTARFVVRWCVLMAQKKGYGDLRISMQGVPQVRPVYVAAAASDREVAKAPGHGLAAAVLRTTGFDHQERRIRQVVDKRPCPNCHPPSKQKGLLRQARRTRPVEPVPEQRE